MAINLDAGAGADWIKGRTWEFSTDPKEFLAEVGGPEGLAHFMTLRAALAMPDSLRRALRPVVREALLLEHPGHSNQKVHGHRGGAVEEPTDATVRAEHGGASHQHQMIPNRETGEEIVRGMRRVWPPGDSTSMAGLPADHQAKIRDITKTAFHGLTDEQMDANLSKTLEKGLANPASAKGLEWYDEAHDAGMQVSKVGHVGEEAGVGMVAALSPQQEWGGNQAAAEYTAKMLHQNPVIPDLSATKTKAYKIDGKTVKVTKTFEEWARDEMASKHVGDVGALVGTKLSDHPPMVQAALIKAMSQIGHGTHDGQPLAYRDDVTGNKSKVSWSCGLDGVAKAIRIWKGETPHEVLNGHKVRSFYNNMLTGRSNNHGDVTMDTHAVSAAAGRKWSAQSDPIKAFTAGTSLKSHGSKGLYAQFADSYRRVAAKHGLSPEQAQAVIWLQWRVDNP